MKIIDFNECLYGIIIGIELCLIIQCKTIIKFATIQKLPRKRPPQFPVQQMNTIGIAFLPHFVALTLLQSCNHLDQNHSCAPDTIPSTSLTLTSPSGYSFLHDCARTKVQSNIRFIFLIAPRRENSAISSPPPRLKTHPKEMLSSHPPPPTTIT